MSSIRVIAAGTQTTVQDLGRFGYAHFGVSASGAADPLALRAGNPQGSPPPLLRMGDRVRFVPVPQDRP